MVLRLRKHASKTDAKSAEQASADNSPLTELEAKIFSSSEDDTLTSDGKTKLGTRFPIYTPSSYNSDETVKEEEEEVAGEDQESSSRDSTHLLEQRFLSAKLRDAESPEEAILELLMVLNSQDDAILFAPETIDQYGCTVFLRPRQAMLRRLLFNNPFVEYFDSLDSLTDDEKWDAWGAKFQESNVRIVESVRTPEELADPTINPNAALLAYAVFKPNRKDQRKTDAAYRLYSDEDITNLKQCFNGDFSAFAKSILLMRSWAFIHDNKQWCYNFIFPFGPDCLYYEITKDHSFKSNYMGGAGLLLYNMLQRASIHNNQVVGICHKIKEIFLDPSNAINAIAQSLQGSSVQSLLKDFQRDVAAEKKMTAFTSYSHKQSKSLDHLQASYTSYLPYREHRVFDQLAQDFGCLVSVNLNQQELFNALKLIGMLNLLTYYAEVCQQINLLCGDETNIDMVVECDHKHKLNLRRLSVFRLNANNTLITDAVTNMLKFYMAGLFDQYDQSSLLTKEEFEIVISKLCDLFNVNKRFKKQCTFDKCRDADERSKRANLASYNALQKIFISFVLSQLSHFIKVHLRFCVGIGLVSKAGTRANRYVISDQLLQALVLSTVDKNKGLVLLDDFLHMLYKKYHIVIGPQEAAAHMVSNTKSANTAESSYFDNNLKAFKEQLYNLGFLINLSDTDSYVKNPYLD